MDLIIGSQQQEAILTLTERKTGYAIIEKLPNGKNVKSLARVVNRSLSYFKRMGLLHSITTDNGSEFMAFRSIERALRIPVFFAKPYCSTDKPHVELLNKLIRQYIPKGTSFKDIDEKQIRNIRMLLNNRPRKKLDFKSPNEVLALLLSYRCTWYWNLQFPLFYFIEWSWCSKRDEILFAYYSPSWPKSSLILSANTQVRTCINTYSHLAIL